VNALTCVEVVVEKEGFHLARAFLTHAKKQELRSIENARGNQPQ